MNCKLALEDGSVFSGLQAGASGTVSGEVVFNTAMSGYQEVLTDPSYCGQIVTMTSSMIGNYGVNTEDDEAKKPHIAGFVVRELSARHNNWRASEDLRSFFKKHNIVAISGIDTRALTRRIRVHGSMRGALSTEIVDDCQLVAMAKNSPQMVGQKLADRVTCSQPEDWDAGSGAPAEGKTLSVTVIDCGAKSNIMRSLADRGCAVKVVPFDTSAEDILKDKPDGIMVSNGPGDPEPVVETVETLRNLIGKVPIFGICLGHQLLCLALGAKTQKLKFGHHGANHPVLNLSTGKVEITSQNHGFAVVEDSLEAANSVVTHRSLNDGSVEGFAHKTEPVFAVQYHPEAAPGPHDSAYLFDDFIRMMEKHADHWERIRD